MANNVTASEITSETYPLQNVPASAPYYVVDSVRAQCNSALIQGLTVKADFVVGTRDQKYRDELYSMRTAYDRAARGEQPLSLPDWYLWGFRTVTKAWEDAAQLARFREALAREDISHVTSGHPCSPHSYGIYVVDSASPSGCHLLWSAAHDLPGVDIVLRASGRHTCQGGQRGEMAARRAMTGG